MLSSSRSLYLFNRKKSEEKPINLNELIIQSGNRVKFILTSDFLISIAPHEVDAEISCYSLDEIFDEKKPLHPKITQKIKTIDLSSNIGMLVAGNFHVAFLEEGHGSKFAIRLVKLHLDKNQLVTAKVDLNERYNEKFEMTLEPCHFVVTTQTACVIYDLISMNLLNPLHRFKNSNCDETVYDKGIALQFKLPAKDEKYTYLNGILRFDQSITMSTVNASQ
jgi:hypothetical protein